MSLRTWHTFIVGLVILANSFFACSTAGAADVSEALSWYDTLGFPDARDLRYVRVATGSYIIRGHKPPENRFTEGFLVSEDAGAFTVFLCSVSDFQDRFSISEPHPPLTVVRFSRRTDVPDHKRVDYEVLDFQKVATDVLARVSDIAAGPEDYKARQDTYATRYPGLPAPYSLQWGQPLSHRARIFSFARACQQKGLVDTAAKLFDISANIPDEQTGKANPAKLRDALQQQIGDTVWQKAEESFGNPSVTLEDLLKMYEPFAGRYPASSRVAYSQEATALLRKMIAEEAEHHPKPLDEMTPTEQVAENIYQLRYLNSSMWIMHNRYPLMAVKDGQKVITPVHRLVDLGNTAVPQLIEALDDRRFTRSMEPLFNGYAKPHVLRVSDVAQRILEHLSGRNFYAGKNSNGEPAKATTRQQAEAWWKEVQLKGDKQPLIEAASAGGDKGLMAARKLAERFPEDTLPAIEAGIRASRGAGYRGEYVEIAGKLPGEKVLAFLRAQLTPDHGVYAQVYAAQALFERGQPEAVPAMIDAWHRIQPRLPRDEGDAFSEVGRIISFLARSGDAKAIEALARDAKAAPVQVRLAVVEVFQDTPFNGGGVGPSVSLYDHVAQLPGGEASDAVERLLVAALDDTERCFGPERNYPNATLKDPRICDAAAFALSSRWPEKYPLKWSTRAAECDPQITKMRDRWRADHGLPAATPTPPPAAIVPAAESEVAPLLDALTAASDDAARAAATTKIVETLGLRALPVVRARLEKSNDAALRSLAIQLASLAREVKIETDVNGMASKSAARKLQGQRLNGELLDRLAHEMESEMPKDVAGVTFVAERKGDGNGFTITIDWLPGVVGLHVGWDRDMAVRAGDETVYRQGHWAAEGAMSKEGIYRDMAAAFDKATQAEIDSPVFLRFRAARGPSK